MDTVWCAAQPGPAYTDVRAGGEPPPERAGALLFFPGERDMDVGRGFRRPPALAAPAAARTLRAVVARHALLAAAGRDRHAGAARALAARPRALGLPGGGH